jgi:hypothetical protein
MIQHLNPHGHMSIHRIHRKREVVLSKEKQGAPRSPSMKMKRRVHCVNSNRFFSSVRELM